MKREPRASAGASVERNLLFSADLSLEAQAPEGLAVLLEPRGDNAGNGASDKEMELKQGDRTTGFWSHNLSNWIMPPLKPTISQLHKPKGSYC